MADLPFAPVRRGDAAWQGPPDGATLGWRAWQVPVNALRFGLPPRLYSVGGSQGFYWKPWRESVAECDAGCDRVGKPGIPNENGHGCGFYSARSFEHLKSLGYPEYDEETSGYFKVVGVVANWGKVIPGSLGWRAEKSYPVKLFVPYGAAGLAKPLKELYRVQVALVNILKNDYDNERDRRVLQVTERS